MMAYVLKPFSAEDLVPAIETARARFVEMRAFSSQAEALGDSSSPARSSTGPRVAMDRDGMSERAFRPSRPPP